MPPGDLESSNDQPFVTTWETTSPDSVVTIPTEESTTDYDFQVEWGDETTETYSGPDPSHSYSEAGTCTVEISGTFPRIYLNADNSFSGGDQANARRLQTIEQWRSVRWENMSYAFAGASDLTYNATDRLDLSGVKEMSFTFRNATSFNGDIGGWDVSQ
ncbi:DUF285 domain-containing protein [Salinibacter ruber]|uniref:DUF285 domain-containing protein n=1 Tax=Salinibacter ruber TaxID=146919 RepID=UPI001F07A447|nr:DUF285 domain-containing protein [Salinibacter ruber]